MLAYIQVRPVKEDGGNLARAFEGDTVFAWGLYATDDDGLPMHQLDFDTRADALDAGRELAAERGWPLSVDELDGTTSWPA